MTSDKYDYTGISENSKQIAIKELNEKPDQVNAHIESFRRWVLSSKHLKCPTDSKFLLRFLRVAKFDHSKAQKRLDNFCTIRSSARGTPKYFNTFDIKDPKFQKIVDSGIHLPLGVNDLGEYVLMVRPKMWKSDEFPVADLFRFICMDMDLINFNEHVQIHGIKLFMDFDGAGKKFFEIFGDPKIHKDISRIMQDCYPMRLKGNIFYKEPAIFDAIFQIMSFFMNEKLRSRMFRAKNDLNKVFEKIPGLERLLPTEYNGKGGSIQSIIDKQKEEFEKYYKNGSPYKNISVDESKRPPETLKNLREYADYTGTTGTFTKYDAY